MPDVKEDFWPETFPDPADPPLEPVPVRLLEEQASLLARKTGGEIEGVVHRYDEEGKVFYSLNLKADALGDYLYKVLEIGFPALGPFVGGPGSFYPISAHRTDGTLSTIENDDEFRAWLKEQLSSTFVTNAIGNLSRYIRDRRASTRAS